MEDEKLADKLLDRILMVLMPYDQIDVERIKAKLTVVLDDYQICPKQEALVVYTEGKNDYYLRKFLLAKAVAGRQERTLRQYKDEVGRVLRGIGKDADTITADDIQVYLAKVLSRGGSKCYCDNIRRDLSSFYNWLYREEIIRTNPMNKIDNIKFKREKEKALTDMEIEMMRQACQTDGYFAEDVYLNLIKSAKHFFYAATPYLIISDDMTRELCLAAERGVDVRIVTPGIPDKKLVYQTTRSYYAPLVRRGVRIYEYTPGFIHQKQTLCDGETATVGTINFDYRSLYHHFENGVLLHGCGAIDAIGEDFAQIFEVSREVTEQYKGKRSMGLRIIQCILRLFAPLL